MQSPKFPKNELQRLNAVKSYAILDSLPEKDYDKITKLIATICEVPIALITVLDQDRNYFKSHYGIPFNESPRDISFCGHAILEDDLLIVPDARQDSRFKGNPLITSLQAIFYAGVPLINPEGYSLGTICVFDHKPRQLNNTQIEALKTLGEQVVNLFELRKKNAVLEKATLELEKRNQQLKTFASHVSHDLKSPLANIISLTNLLRDDNTEQLSEDSNEYLNYIEESTTVLKDYIDGILLYYKSDELLKSNYEDVSLDELSEDLKQILIGKNDRFIFPENTVIKSINKSALSQILINLIDNALKYNDKPERLVTLTYDSDLFNHIFSVSDNGIGIPQDKQQYIFEIFKTIKNDYGKSSTGIGLSTVKNLVEKLGGEISVSSKTGQGSTFHFTLAKTSEFYKSESMTTCELV
ncbi:GAF domain-containing sensor histidine kinase [Psychroserpens sp. SPM9]|uniref:sensor histidine kinase n=1 Tax=Psychroserpens sp. SPM9 TaxID=2975598 RepID=UPI0021A7440E|nr:GAF domain-containing sensor histidine kinase [Psychroserpens sp. SPM9]MDG5491919.1 GAF domain-containing sensor histidine kinase [Psychroserpens sp. SPM9]